MIAPSEIVRTAVLASLLGALGQSAEIDPTCPLGCVAKGTDYFMTVPGTTAFDFGPGIGVVNFVGRSLALPGLGVTDTIVQRLGDAQFNSPVNLMLTALSLKDASPINIGGSFFDVFVALDPAHLANDTGSMTISGNLNGGTFTSTLNVFFTANFVPVTTGNPFTVSSSTSLVNTGTSWGPRPLSVGLLVTCADDDSAADQGCNHHTGLASNEVDFYTVVANVDGTPTGSSTVHNGPHGVTDTQVPEPATSPLIGAALVVLVGFAWRNRRS
jgi:hypothetical protein